MLAARFEGELKLDDAHRFARVYRIDDIDPPGEADVLSPSLPAPELISTGTIILAGGGVDDYGEINAYIAGLVPEDKSLVFDLEPTEETERNIRDYTTWFTTLGIKKVDFITENTTRADAESMLEDAAGVGVIGGNQYLLADRWARNDVGHVIAEKVAAGDIFYYGTSAGSAITAFDEIALIDAYVETHNDERRRTGRAIRRAINTGKKAVTLDCNTAGIWTSGELTDVLGTGRVKRIGWQEAEQMSFQGQQSYDVFVAPVYLYPPMLPLHAA